MVIFLDCEVARDYFLVVFSDGKKFREFEMYDEHPLDRLGVLAQLSKHTTCGFNSINYDLPILWHAIKRDATTEKVFQVSQDIIVKNTPHWEVARVPDAWKHIDLKEVAPGVMVSLKVYGGRLHTYQMQDLPFDPEACVLGNREQIIEYCKNDVRITAELYASLREQIDLRYKMSEQYDLGLLSKSDAQVAEAVLIKEIEIKTDTTIPKPSVGKSGADIFYTPPAWVQFETLALNQLLKDVKTTPFRINSGNGSVELTGALEDRTIVIGESVYRFGAGGLHSSESKVSLYSNDTHTLTDTDVASYYPAIILNEGLYPKACGPEFLNVYKSIVDRRLAAKAAHDDVTAASLKIAINGSFGKLGSRYSKLYAPNLLIQTTVTGQLGLLMLIESLELAGISVVSGNTDGIVTYTNKQSELRAIINYWESVTGFNTESVKYSSVHWRDVNNYLAIKTDGKVKGKGVYTTPGLMKNPAMSIVYRAVSDFLSKGVAIEETIRSGEFKEYLTVRNVKGGGYWTGKYLGKVVRFYWSTEGHPLQYKNGNQVATSSGSKPAMRMLNELPADLDFERYILVAKTALTELGVKECSPSTNIKNVQSPTSTPTQDALCF